jgi:hypothetical protein
MFDVERSMFEVQVVVFGVQAVKVLLTAFSLQPKRPDLLSAATTLFNVRFQHCIFNAVGAASCREKPTKNQQYSRQDAAAT